MEATVDSQRNLISKHQMKIIIAPDKFKGSLTSIEVCASIRDGLQHAGEFREIIYFPIADGGDGFADVMKSPVSALPPLSTAVTWEALVKP